MTMKIPSVGLVDQLRLGCAAMPNTYMSEMPPVYQIRFFEEQEKIKAFVVSPRGKLARRVSVS